MLTVELCALLEERENLHTLFKRGKQIPVKAAGTGQLTFSLSISMLFGLMH